jgi:hypothetical protein
MDTGGLEDLPKALAVFGIAVNDQVRLAQRETVRCVNELTSRPSHPIGVGRQRGAAHVHGA